MIKLAIIIPYYKVSFFSKTLQSLASQSDKRFNLYIGNDNSPYDIEDLLNKFDEKLNFVYKKFNENLGGSSLVKQWERCIDMSQEDWFMILGDDDWLSENVVEEFYKNLEKVNLENINVIKLNSAIVDESDTIQYEKKPEPTIKSSIEHFFDKYSTEGRSSLSEHIFRRSSYNAIGFADLPFAWHSDDLALLEFSNYTDIFFIKKATCFVRISSESISGNPEKNRYEKWQASRLFFNRICKNLNKFDTQQKRKLFDIIEWQENAKNIKIKIPNKFLEYLKCYGTRGILKYFLR